VDLHSKYCSASNNYSNEGEAPEISIEANQNSIHLLDGGSSNEDTIISFPQFKGYKVFAVESSGKYSINVCLFKE